MSGDSRANEALPGTDRHLQLFIQAQKSITGTDTGNTHDLQAAIGLQWAF